MRWIVIIGLILLTACGESPNSPTDPKILDVMKFVAEHAEHGTRDNVYTPEQLVAKIQNGERVSVTCTTVSTMAKIILEQHGFQSRNVLTLTAGAWDGDNDGHSMLEVWDESNQKWTLFDLDNNVQILIHGKAATIVDFTQAVAANDYQLFYLSGDQAFDPSWQDQDINPKEFNLRAWYQHVIQIPSIKDGDFYYFPNNQETDRIENYFQSMRGMDQSQFQNLFYQGGEK